MANVPYYAVSVGTTAVALTTPGYYGVVAIYNNGAATVYVGTDAAVTTLTGFPVAPAASLSIASNGSQPSLFGISTSAQDVRLFLSSV